MDIYEFNDETEERGKRILRRMSKGNNPAKNVYRRQEKEEMINLGFKTRKAYLKALKKERMSK
jgi:hypothetical protein